MRERPLDVTPEPFEETPAKDETAWRTPVLVTLLVVLVVALVLSFFLSPLNSRLDEPSQPPGQALDLKPPTPVAPATVKVYVAGEVHRPGVVTLPGDSRVEDAVKAVGGMKPDADPLSVNLAKRVRDEDQIVVRARRREPSPGEASRSSAGDGSQTWAPPQEGSGSLGAESAGEVLLPEQGAASVSDGPGRVSLNASSAEELAAGVRGLGPQLARAVVEYREQRGPFATLEDLLNVPGIGPAKLEQIRTQVDL